MNAVDGSPRRPIRRLSPTTIERIAAGEVVERPASVVKELVENAVDAGASRVTIRLDGGGRARIEVADDGLGIPPDELPLAIERHATSKLPPDGPIERIDSLGFRGEALAAVAAVSRLRLLSRTPDREVAEGVSAAGGAEVGRFAAPRAPGTTVVVDDLFFQTPARRNFLRTPAAEQLEVLRTVERLFLAHPSLGLRVEAEGKEIAVYPATTSLHEAGARVLGPDFADASFSVAGDIPGGRLFGVLGTPTVAARSSSSLYLAVNGRAITSRPLAQAVRLAYGDSIPRTRFPVGVVHLELTADRLDVNVHPTKREVRFLAERELMAAVRRCVRSALETAPRLTDAPMIERTSVRGGVPAPPGASPMEIGTAALVSARSASAQTTLEPAGPATAPRTVEAAPSRPRLELLGPVHDLYWVASTPDGLVLIDQHAASERVLYELLLRDGVLARQSLVEPVRLTLSGTERAALSAHGDEVRAAGFDVEPFGPDTFRIGSVPSFRGQHARPEALHELLGELAGGGRPTMPDGLAERTAATIACHAAIRAGDVVERDTIARLVTSLDGLGDRGHSCPHGRPIMVRLPRARLDRWFLRSGA